MTGIPAKPKIYHITYVDNLVQITRAGLIWSDARRIEGNVDCQIIGMSEIKQRRLEELPVSCHPGTKVGDYVPFYFCPRSIMLYILHRGNHPDISYRQGQNRIVHLQADLLDTVTWAKAHDVRWAFSNVNAGARYAEFFSDVAQLDQINWEAVGQDDFRNPVIKEGKQAEFLVFESFPWHLVEKVGVIDAAIVSKVNQAISNTPHQPVVNVERTWYF
jgi:hypothetical protein